MSGSHILPFAFNKFWYLSIQPLPTVILPVGQPLPLNTTPFSDFHHVTVSCVQSLFVLTSVQSFHSLGLNSFFGCTLVFFSSLASIVFAVTGFCSVFTLF
jgi:hypothetical protein